MGSFVFQEDDEEVVESLVIVEQSDEKEGDEYTSKGPVRYSRLSNNVQGVIIMQAGNFPKTNKHAGCNKAMQVEIFQKSIVKKSSWLKNFRKLINVQDVIRPCRLETL